MQLGDLAAAADGDAVAIELVDEIVRHGLPELCAAMEERHDRAATSQPDGGLPRRVASPNHADPGRSALAGLGRARRVEDADTLVRFGAGDGEAAVVRAGREHNSPR